MAANGMPPQPRFRPPIRLRQTGRRGGSAAGSPWGRAAPLLPACLILWLCRPGWSIAGEDWQARAWSTFYYTDDVALFSASRRLSLNADPTQPALDDRLTGQGSDGVFEPGLKLSRNFRTDFGTTRLEASGDGYVYLTRTQFTHGTLRLQAQQAFTDTTALNLIYYYSPDLYLGENLVRQPGLLPAAAEPDAEAGPLAPEVLTSNIVSLRLDQSLTSTLGFQLLARYGSRRYDPAFAQRDLDFWTLGPHLSWKPLAELTWLVGYHFERGLADGRRQPWLADDVSYDNNFVSTELEYEFAERNRLTLGLHYELNDWLSRQARDARYGTCENVYQGEILLSYDFSALTRLYGGVQYSSRSINTDDPAITNLNVAFGIRMDF